MSLSRAIIGHLSSSATRSTRRLFSRHLPFAASAIAALSTDATANCSSERRPEPKPEAGLENLVFAERNANDTANTLRPVEAPFNPQVANTVHLVAAVGVKPQLQLLPDGSYATVTVLVHGKTNNFPWFWIPTIFHGDLAHIAAYHLKENDVVYVVGKLSGDEPPSVFRGARTNVLFFAHSLNYVRKESLDAGQHSVDGKDESLVNASGNTKKSETFTHELWHDILLNPQDWKDNRADKLNGLVNPNFPDFKHKDGKSLWLNRAPSWVLEKLDTLTFAPMPNYIRLIKEKVLQHPRQRMLLNLWRALVDNPNQWWDNRGNKLNENSPDFKHKESGEGLWLHPSTPKWVLLKLPSLHPKSLCLPERCTEMGFVEIAKSSSQVTQLI